MVAGPIVGEAIGGPEDSCLCLDNGELDNRLWWTSLRCSLSQSMVGEAQEKKSTIEKQFCDVLIEVKNIAYLFF